MLCHLFLLLPSAVSLVFFFKFLTSKSKHRSHILLVLVSLVSIFYFFADAYHYASDKDYHALVVCNVISAYTAPVLPALVILLLRSIVFEKYLRWYSSFILFFLSFTLGAMTLTQYLLMGMDGSAEYLRTVMESHYALSDVPPVSDRTAFIHYIITIVMYYTISGALCLLTLWHIANYMRKTKFSIREIGNFLFHGHEIEPLHLEGLLFICIFVVCVVRMLVFQHFVDSSQCVAAVFSLILAVFSWLIYHVGVYIDRPTLTLKVKTLSPQTLSPTLQAPQPPKGAQGDWQQFLPDGDSDYPEASLPLGGDGGGLRWPVSVSYKDLADEEFDRSQLFRNLQQYVADEKPYLSPTLSLEDVASALCSNKTYVSRCINSTLHQTFRDYINSLRIDHAKQMMLSHPDYVQDEIASHSGFTDAPSFNRKFKQLVGMTPRQWLLSQEE